MYYALETDDLKWFREINENRDFLNRNRPKTMKAKDDIVVLTVVKVFNLCNIDVVYIHLWFATTDKESRESTSNAAC